MNGLNCLIPYDFAICGLAKMNYNSMIKSYDIINISYPAEWLDLYIRRKFHQIDPIVKENFSNFRLQYWADTYKRYSPPKDFLCRAEDFGLKEGYTSGVRNPQGSRGSLFSIADKSMKPYLRTEAILEHIIPHLHQTLIRILERHKEKQNNVNINLSQREKEVLQWIKLGKSTWETSVILGISRNTVKFHVKSILQKLDAVCITQAVGVAIEQNLIDID
ncbi:MAG: LuxR family transcriptional regulator [Nitrospirae bacterium]|nr:LuxR family transcriptional regulator [Nitrospirota bacterium]